MCSWRFLQDAVKVSAVQNSKYQSLFLIRLLNFSGCFSLIVWNLWATWASFEQQQIECQTYVNRFVTYIRHIGKQNACSKWRQNKKYDHFLQKRSFHYYGIIIHFNLLDKKYAAKNSFTCRGIDRTIVTLYIERVDSTFFIYFHIVIIFSYSFLVVKELFSSDFIWFSKIVESSI